MIEILETYLNFAPIGIPHFEFNYENKPQLFSLRSTVNKKV